jgi:3,4-dihydroxy 2-butanone 4-phosphate synthase/GTP cyclohydrolase II
MRSGHTEAAVDLCRLAGLEPVGVLAELVNDDGTVKRGGDIARFAVENGLRTVSVADLIAHRQRSERLVERVAEFPIVTHAGPAMAYAYRTPFDATQHLAVVFGDIGDGRRVPVRLHREAVIDDVFGGTGILDKVLARLAKSGRGIVVYLREGSTGVAEVSARARDAMKPQDSTAARQSEWREIGLGAQILKDLGVKSIKLIARREHRYVGLGGFGIIIDETEKP